MSGAGPFGSEPFGTGTFSDAPFYSVKEIIDAVLRNTGHADPANETSKRQSVLNFINNRYNTVASSRHWRWLYSNLDFNMKGAYNTGTINVVQGSNAVVGVGTAWSSVFAPGWKILPNGGKAAAFTVDSIESPNNLTMLAEWADASTVAMAYRLVKNLYFLPGNLADIHSVSVYGVGKLVPIGTQEMRLLQANDPQNVGPPRFYTFSKIRESDGLCSMEIYPYPEQDYQCFIDYSLLITKLTDSADSYPLIPDRHRNVLYYGALADMYAYLRELDSAQMAEASYNRMYLLMVGDVQLTDSRLTFNARYRYRKRRWYPGVTRVFMNRLDFSRYD